MHFARLGLGSLHERARAETQNDEAFEDLTQHR